MRIVLDTNVLVSALLNPDGAPGRVLDLVVAGSIRRLWDDRLLAEYDDVLARPKFGFSTRQVKALIDYLRLSGESILATPLELLRTPACQTNMTCLSLRLPGRDKPTPWSPATPAISPSSNTWG